MTISSSVSATNPSSSRKQNGGLAERCWRLKRKFSLALRRAGIGRYPAAGLRGTFFPQSSMKKMLHFWLFLNMLVQLRVAGVIKVRLASIDSKFPEAEAM